MSVMPICGDQSCGLGVYNRYNKDLKWPDNLFWGKRDLSDFPVNIPKTYVTTSEYAALEIIRSKLESDKIVNVVIGDMEFGARALGHTSTLMLPNKDNVVYNNMLNDRPTIMPCAGMVSDKYLKHSYDLYDRVYKSLEYMIVTLNFKFALTVRNRRSSPQAPYL